MLPALERLKRDGKIAEVHQPVAIYTRREFTSLADPNVADFSSEEIDTLLTIALEIAPRTASEVSEMSHDALWEVTAPGGRMSVEAGSVRFATPTPEDVDWARNAFAAG